MSNPNPIRKVEIKPHPLDSKAQEWWENNRAKKTLRSKNRGLSITEIYRKVILKEEISVF